MGFPLEGVVSAEGHISEFICAICQLLAEYPVLTKCSNEHVFCQSCLDKWFKCKRSCPKCNGDLALPRAVRPLKEASPLAHRVLQRVKVKCPLSEQLGCAWQGDYGGVHAHLTNSEGHTGFDRTPPAASSSKQRQSSSQSSGPATDHHAGGMTWGDVGVQGNGVAPRQADPYHGTPGSGPSGVSASSSSAAASYLSSSSSQSSHPSSTSGSRDVMASIAALKREGDGKFELKQFKDAAALYTKALNVGTAAMRDDGGGGWGDGSDCGGDGGGDGSATASSGAASPAPPASSAAAGKEGEEGEREDADGDQVVVEDASDSESEGGGGAEGGGGGGAAETGPREEILGMPPSPPTLAPALSLPPPPPPPPPPTPPPSASSSAASGVSSGAPSTPSDLARLVAACYTNRAACELMLRNYRRCADDCGLAVALDPSFVRAHTRRAKALAELGEFKQAAAHLSQARTAQPSNRTPLAEEHKKVLGMAAALEDARAWCRAGDFKRARATTAALLQQTRASSVVLMAARAELGLGLTDRALRHTLTVLRAGGGQACESRPEACVLRGQAMLWGGSSGSGGSGGGGGSWAAAETQAAELAREALRLDPDHQEAKTLLKLLRRFSALHAAARADFNKREFATAVAKYSELLSLCGAPPQSPLHAELLGRRATAHLRLKKLDQCLQDAARAIYARDDTRDAWLAKCAALRQLGRPQEALDDLEGLMQRWGQSDALIRQEYDRSEFEVRKLKRPDFYKALGVGPNATEGEIKSAYRHRALEFHPDRLVDRPAEECARAEAIFKQLGDFLEILTDPVKRKLYDEGFDKKAIEERAAAAHRAAHENPHRHHHH